MLEFRKNAGLSCPAIACDICKEEIKEARKASVVQQKTDAPIHGGVWFCHKGECETSMLQKVGDPLRIELVDFLSQLCSNTGFSPGK